MTLRKDSGSMKAEAWNMHSLHTKQKTTEEFVDIFFPLARAVKNPDEHKEEQKKFLYLGKNMFPFKMYMRRIGRDEDPL